MTDGPDHASLQAVSGFPRSRVRSIVQAGVQAGAMASVLAIAGAGHAQETAPATSDGARGGLELTVLGQREHQTAGSVHMLQRKDLDRFHHTDPMRVMLQVPGVYVRQEDGFGLRPNIGMRGANSDRSKKITLMEDGVLFAPAPYTAPAAYYFPLIGRMRAVNVYKGPAAIAYGPQTVAGAIDLRTEEVPELPSTMVDMAFGSFGTVKLHGRAGATMGRLGVLLEAAHLGSTGFKQLDGVGGDTGFSRNEVMGKAAWALPIARGTHELGLKLTYSDERSNETYLGLTDADFRANPYRRYLASAQDRMAWNRSSLVITHKLAPSADFEIETNVYRHDLDRVWRKVNGVRDASLSNVLADPGSQRNNIYYNVLTGQLDSPNDNVAVVIGPNDRSFISQGVQTTFRHVMRGQGWENRLSYGYRVHHEDVARVHTEDGFTVEGTELVRDRRPTVTTTRNDASTLALAMHVADAFQWRRLSMTPGLRLELIRSTFHDALDGVRSTGTEQVLLPGVGTHVAITRQLGLLAGVYRGFSPPPPGSTVLRAEVSNNWEAGARWSGRRLRAEVIGFLNDYQNLTDVCTFSNGCVGADLDRQFDAGAVLVYGLEAYAAGELRAGDVTFPYRGSYTFTQSRFPAPFESADPQFGTVREGDRLPYVPEHQIYTMLGAETKRYGLSAAFTFVDRSQEIAGQGLLQGLSTDAYGLLDVGAYYRILPEVKLYADARNLTDTAYLASRRPFGARPGAPQTFQIGLRIDL